MKDAIQSSLVSDECVSVDTVEKEYNAQPLSTTVHFKGTIRLSFIQTLENLLKKALKSRFTENKNGQDGDNCTSEISQNSNSIKATQSNYSNENMEDGPLDTRCANSKHWSEDEINNEMEKGTCCTLS
jgi:hypothetical protein